MPLVVVVAALVGDPLAIASLWGIADREHERFVGGEKRRDDESKEESAQGQGCKASGSMRRAARCVTMSASIRTARARP